MFGSGLILGAARQIGHVSAAIPQPASEFCDAVAKVAHDLRKPVAEQQQPDHAHDQEFGETNSVHKWLPRSLQREFPVA